jgi:competence protein ComFB
MKLHNQMEDVVKSEVDKICDSIDTYSLDGEICTCAQCRLDAACYVLNRVQAHYFVSNRGLAREEQNTQNNQQLAVDVTVLILNALKIVGHNRRNAGDHKKEEAAAPSTEKAVFNIPAIVGRLLDGRNFEPLQGIAVELFSEGTLVPMKNGNWQNPCYLSPQAEGAYTFWPQSTATGEVGAHKIFDFLLKVEMPGLESLQRHLKVPVISESVRIESLSKERTFHVSDLYMFPPENEQ